MQNIYAMIYNIIMGGWLKGKRTQVLGYATLLGTFAYAVVQWMVGDMTLVQVMEWVKENWEQLALGYGLVFVGDRMDVVKAEVEAKK